VKPCRKNDEPNPLGAAASVLGLEREELGEFPVADR
jgi:hypothetical protein